MTSARQGGSNLGLVIMLLVVGGAMLLLWRQAGRHPPSPVTPALVSTPAAGPPVSQPPGGGDDTVELTPALRAIPGVVPTTRLRYANAAARQVAISGSWDYWATPHPLTREGERFLCDVAPLMLAVGRYEYKFIVDGKWESGDNRILYVNMQGQLERPEDLIVAAGVEAADRIDVLFRREVEGTPAVTARLVPDVPISRVTWRAPRGPMRTTGYAVAGEFVSFYLDESVYGLQLPASARVVAAGTFNGWRTGGGADRWRLRDDDNDNLWTVTVRMDALTATTDGGLHEFKFVVDDNRWLQAPVSAPNAAPDGKGNINLRLDPKLATLRVLEVHTAQPIDLAAQHLLILEGMTARPAMREISPGAALDDVQSDQPLGALLDPAAGDTTFRLYAPRAKGVDLHLYDGPAYRAPGGKLLDPRAVHPLTRHADGTWETRLPGLLTGQYYAYRLDGPAGAGEGFSPHKRVADPYAVAVAHSHNNAIVLDTQATNRWFGGWTDGAHRTPPYADLVIYETHVRNLTHDPSSGVQARWRGKYAGLLASIGTGTGLDHLKQLGVNVIELMPPAEFWNGEDRYDWGYGPSHFFAPEASFAQEPLAGSQFYEFKQLVNELHRQGFSVILDMVYNHMGVDNPLEAIDRKYYFRQDQDYTLRNYSGCGNDVRTEAPMMRRLIVDNVRYWMREHHVDGFRFDLADLVDFDTLMAVRDAVRAENPNGILISEPWSGRGDHRLRLKGQPGWAAWNGDFRYAVWRFVRGEGNRDQLMAQVRGAVDVWTATPAQAVNYIESHDDKALADEITTNPGGDGRKLNGVDAARNRLAATILFTSLGIPMISEGQEWIRSKGGRHNTFDGGDEVNALRWTERERPEAARTLAYYRDLVRLRRSPAGASLRWQQAIPDQYVTWIDGSDGRALGYMLNGERKHPGAAFVVLLNGADREVDFAVGFPAGSQWRLIADGRRMEAQGIPWQPAGQGEGGRRTVRVPPVTGYIFIGM